MINEIFETLAGNASRNFKIDYLNQHKDNKTLKEVIRLALDPYTQFFIRKIPHYGIIGGDTLEQGLDQLTHLSKRMVTGNAAIEFLSTILARQTPDNAKVIERVIEKDLRCGVSESTANKIWPNLVMEYPVMLASGYEDRLVEQIEWPAYVQLKMDGMRFNAIVKNNQVEFRSRNGKLIDIPDVGFDAPFLALADHYKCEMVFDGELLVADENELPLDRKTGNGILNKAVKGTMIGTEAKKVRATLWDAIPFGEFEKEKSDEPYQHRFAKLDNAISHVKNNYPSFIHTLIKLIWHKQVSSLEEARSIFEKFLSDGQEGIILKTRNGVWENKRAKHQIKFKGEYECDLLCVGWEEGTGKNVGRLGALLLESSCGQLKVGVGSGLTDDDRINIGKDVVGKIIAIKYNAIVDDKQTNIKSLFLPIFLEVREDKQTADVLSSLKG
jgi:ATP-dependent DNA ligase